MYKRSFRYNLKRRRRRKALQKLPFSEIDKKRKGEIHPKTAKKHHNLTKRGKVKTCSKPSLFLQKYFTNEIKGYLLRAIKSDSPENKNDAHGCL